MLSPLVGPDLRHDTSTECLYQRTSNMCRSSQLLLPANIAVQRTGHNQTKDRVSPSSSSLISNKMASSDACQCSLRCSGVIAIIWILLNMWTHSVKKDKKVSCMVFLCKNWQFRKISKNEHNFEHNLKKKSCTASDDHNQSAVGPIVNRSRISW